MLCGFIREHLRCFVWPQKVTFLLLFNFLLSAQIRTNHSGLGHYVPYRGSCWARNKIKIHAHYKALKVLFLILQWGICSKLCTVLYFFSINSHHWSFHRNFAYSEMSDKLIFKLAMETVRVLITIFDRATDTQNFLLCSNVTRLTVCSSPRCARLRHVIAHDFEAVNECENMSQPLYLFLTRCRFG